jgi:hypothetical protein
MLLFLMLGTVLSFCYVECHYAECHHAECHYAECRYAKCHYAECHYAECRSTKQELIVLFFDRKYFLKSVV